LNVRLEDRACASFEISEEIKESDALLCLDIDETFEEEEYSIENFHCGLKITGGSETALLYGIGKMLRTATYKNGRFSFGSWRGRSAPAKPFRCMYFATHFFNYYHLAPIEEIIKYMEDLALLGYNALMMWLDKHHYESSEDPKYIDFAMRLKSIYEAGSLIGLRPVLGVLSNEGFNSTPEHSRAQSTGRSFFGCEICPSTDEGMALILKNHEETFKIFSGLDVYACSMWSYDQGGCGCEKCYPWGANGMYECVAKSADLFCEYFPGGEIIYSSWLFDHCGEKEWEGLYKRLETENKNIFKYLFVDSHNNFPEFPLEKGKPDGVDFLNFPEISMWKMFPWGGFGANPLPERFSRLWEQAFSLCDGGMPYSEGIYEDFNKAIYAAFYWNGNSETEDAIREYFNYEFGGGDLDGFSQAIGILEENHGLIWRYLPNKCNIPKNFRRLKNKEDVWASEKEYKNAGECFRFLDDINNKIPGWAKKSWRWRILYIRGLIDMILDKNAGEPDCECEDALRELAAIYHVNNMMDRVSPITDEFISAEPERCRSGEPQSRDYLERPIAKGNSNVL
jgi:hypothetical protein